MNKNIKKQSKLVQDLPELKRNFPIFLNNISIHVEELRWFINLSFSPATSPFEARARHRSVFALAYFS
jgi:hypothetical protein